MFLTRLKLTKTCQHNKFISCLCKSLSADLDLNPGTAKRPGTNDLRDQIGSEDTKKVRDELEDQTITCFVDY